MHAFVFSALLLGSPAADASVRGTLAPLDAVYPELDALYRDLHRTPELSHQEEKTAGKMAARLRTLGFEVTERVGGWGVVGVLKNGKGPTVMLRTDLDGLPMKEKTDLEFASTATAKNAAGETVPVMHGCGHDVHMTSWIGAATLLARAKEGWRGTLVMVAQPAEELGEGARAMLKDGLFTRFPKPDYALALHDTNELPAGRVAWVAGYALANVDSVDVTVYGRGGHGAYPHTTVDPIVLASKIVLSLQTIVSRENDPLQPAVVTVGSIHGGTKHNIIPDEVKLQLTVRSYDPAVRDRLIAAIRRIARAEADAAGAPKEPLVVLDRGPSATYNDPAVTKRVVGALSTVLAPDAVLETKPRMGAEDFSEYGRAGVPAVMLWLGAADPKAFAKAEKAGQALPSLHSPLFAPAREPTIRTGVTTLTAAALELFGKP